MDKRQSYQKRDNYYERILQKTKKESEKDSFNDLQMMPSQRFTLPSSGYFKGSKI